MNICNILQRFLVSIPGLPVAGAALGAMAGSRGQNLMVVFESLRDENRPHPENRTEDKEAGLLGPTKSRLGSNLAVLGVKLGRTGAHLRPTWA